MKTTLLAAALLAATSTAAFAMEKTSAMTQDFVTQASVSGMFEIESSKLALQKSYNADVKAFASKMITDHKAADAKMKATIMANHIDAKPAKALDSKHQEIIADLKAANAHDFDAQYIDAQEEAHEEAVNLFTDYSTDGDNAKLKKFAANTLPTLQKHKDHVDALDEKM